MAAEERRRALGARRRGFLRAALVALLRLASAIPLDAAAGAVEGEPTKEAQPPPAPGWGPLAYEAPVPGTYELPPLGAAANGEVLDVGGRRRRLHEFLGDKVVVLSFFYRSCPDVNGCPLANYVLSCIARRLRDDPDLRRSVRLVSVSFDPAHDPPEELRRYGASLTREGDDWQFLTGESQSSLAPLLRAYGQAVRVERGADGKPLGTFSHVLRVYLIDRARRIRNIYSSSFLHADMVSSDIRTLLRESERRTDDGSARTAEEGPNDDGGPRTGLMGLPAVPVPADNPMTPEKVALGHKLFFDPRLSRNDTMSCAMCHVPAQGFTSNQMATAVGIEGRSVRRNAPTILNTAYTRLLFHDGRETRLEQQVWGPLLARNEMGAPSVGYVLDKVGALPDYAGLFEAAFDGRRPTMETLGMALACYERSLVSADSRFDRWYFGKEEGALSAAGQRGFGLFRGKAGCVRCHAIADDHALFTDQGMHNTGVGYRQTMLTAGPARVQVAPGTFLAVDRGVVADASETPPSDLGRYEISENPDDRWKYTTPSLRNVALTAPYMHDGSLPTLSAVVDFYDRGGVANELLDHAIRRLDLGETEKADLVAFLESLTGGNVGALLAEAPAESGNP